MRIAVTGGTGYVGAHTVRALLEAGHEAKLLVTRDEAGAAVLDRLRALGPLTVTVGDIRDADAVSGFLSDTDALFHGAGVVGTDERHTELMWEVNAYATESVLATAVRLGLAPVVSVNSYSALFPAPDGVISPGTPTAPGRSSYAQTKGYADAAARRLQADGAPVVITYPSSVVGPGFFTAPGVTERGWAPIAQWAVAPSVRGGMQMIDVRDVAEVHLRVLEKVREPRRFICGGVMLTFDEMVDALEDGLGRQVRRIPIAPSVFRGMGRIADVAGRYVPIADGLSYEAALLLTAATPTDDSATLRELGVTWRHPRGAIVRSVRGRGSARGET